MNDDPFSDLELTGVSSASRALPPAATGLSAFDAAVCARELAARAMKIRPDERLLTIVCILSRGIVIRRL